MERIDTPESSNVTWAEYDATVGELTVVYRNAEPYIYEAVPQNVWDDLKAADSPGGYLNSVVKPQYGFHR